MTPQEQQMLNDLVGKITSTQLQEKDPDAEAFLRQGLGHDQDALYKLAQTVLVQNIALDQARRQLQQMQQGAAQQPARATSFLGSLFGHKDAPPQQAPQQAGGYQQVPPSYAQPVAPGFGQQAAGYAPAPSGQPSFLRSAATTAAGVAAGALAFEGVESLLHGGHEGFGGGYGGDWGGGGFGGGERPTEEIVTNNYYDDNTGGGGNAGGNYGGGPDEQPQGGGYDAGAYGGPDEQPQGGDDSSSYGDDAGGGFDDGSDFGGDESNFA